MLIDFAKTMIGWMSFNIRDEFAKTRRNLFHNFQYITTVTSPTEALQIAPNIPKVFISTPVALNQGFTAVSVPSCDTTVQYNSHTFKRIPSIHSITHQHLVPFFDFYKKSIFLFYRNCFCKFVPIHYH